jgi:hypothetical protein
MLGCAGGQHKGDICVVDPHLALWPEVPFGLPTIAFMIFADVRCNDVEFEPKIFLGIFKRVNLLRVSVVTNAPPG